MGPLKHCGILKMDLKRVDDLYRDKVILDHCRNPRNADYLDNSDIHCDAINLFCGDEVHIQINVDDFRKITNVGYQSEGCAINQAAGSLISEYIKGLDLSQVHNFISEFSNMLEDKSTLDFDEELIPKLGDLTVLYRVKEFPIRIKCVLLSMTALETGLDKVK